MKKLSLSLVVFFAAMGSTYAQADKLLLEAQRKTLLDAKKKADESVMKKDSLKAKTWLTRAEAYIEIASSPDTNTTKLEPLAAIKAYDFLKKAASLDVKDGKEGDVAKTAKKYLKVEYNKEGKPEGEGQKLYSAFMNVGVQKYQAKDFEGALANISMASTVNPKDTTAAMYTGVVGQMAKNEAAAKEGFERFLTAGGKDPGIIYGLAQIYKNEKNDEKAIATIERGIQLNPSNKDLRNEKINMLLAMGKAGDAINDLKALSAKEPSNSQYLLNLAILYDNSASKYDGQISDIKQKLQQNDTESAKKKLQDQKDKISAFDEEIKRLTDKIKKDPKTAASSKKQLADVVKMRDDQKAVLEQMNAEAAKQAASAVNVADLTKQLEELTKKQAEDRGFAAEYYKKSLAINPNDFDANYNMGVFYFNEGVKIKGKVDSMDMKTYQKDGKAIEQSAISTFKESMPYFEKAWEIKKEDDLKGNLRGLYNVLKQLEKSEAYDAKLKALE
ncbi:hypothetical protein SAMN04515674_101334 [Pseudarcicella hirudinis]|uniref:Uncharacterized protein n=1 Tax=Pseudarcicella hirudinis TaxID=1079859 RepID=A0A1I5MJ61_9BACT|nr:tetratricopeptide repeat protein [Pseudarcicella hirudinis]SFP09625.1 hypothetical protein SAMN04515674_101334 [Pseudarcicella hirudinis]